MDQEQYYTFDQVAEILSMSRRSVENLVSEQRIAVIQLSPRRRRISSTALAEFLHDSVKPAITIAVAEVSGRFSSRTLAYGKREAVGRR